MKRPKRRIPNMGQYLLFEDMVISVEKNEKSILEEQYSLLQKYPTKRIENTEVGLTTNKIYCGDTVETMKKIKDKT